MKYLQLLICLFAATLFINCSTEDDNTPVDPVITKARRTVIVYITGDNNLADSLNKDISEMVTGSQNLPSDCRLVAFYDNNSLPRIVEIKNGKMKKVKEWEEDFHTTHPDSMLSIYKWIISQYPADEYATIIEGHGTGPIISNDTIKISEYLTLNAYGWDNKGKEGGNSKWINMPSMARVFKNLPHMAYIFFDCCCMQSIEVAYELRNYTDYIIASASEVPGSGAPYTSIVPVLYGDKNSVGDSIIYHYIKDTDWRDKSENKTYGGICISCVKTGDYVLENLMLATRNALDKIYTDKSKPLTLSIDHENNKKCIYYYKGPESGNTRVLHDMKDVMRNNLSEDDFNTWVRYLDAAVVARYMPQTQSGDDLWPTSLRIDYATFEMTKENYGGISMIVPNKFYNKEYMLSSYPSINTTMFQLLWANALGWHNYGW